MDATVARPAAAGIPAEEPVLPRRPGGLPDDGPRRWIVVQLTPA